MRKEVKACMVWGHARLLVSCCYNLGRLMDPASLPFIFPICMSTSFFFCRGNVPYGLHLAAAWHAGTQHKFHPLEIKVKYTLHAIRNQWG